MVSIPNPHRRQARLWSYVVALFVMAAQPTPVMAQDIQWIRQFGSASNDQANRVAVDATGVYIAGITDGNLVGQTSAGFRDAFVRKHDANGNVLWTRQFGSATIDEAYGVAVDGTGVYVVGVTSGTLPGQTSAGTQDAFVRKYDANGNELWTRQFSSTINAAAFVAAVDATGVYVVGVTSGTLPGQTSAGTQDTFVRKYDASGTEQWTRQFGSANIDYAYGVAVDATGLYVVGRAGGALPGQTSAGTQDAFVRKYDASGTEQWTRQFGSPDFDEAYGVAVDATGVYVAGITDGNLVGQTSTGGIDAFVRKYDASGSQQWTRQFGSPGSDFAFAVGLDATGIYVVGHTSGTLPGQTSVGQDDAFARKYDADSNELWTRQFGSTSNDAAVGVAVDVNSVYVGGRTDGTLPGQTRAGGADAFVVKLAETTPGAPPGPNPAVTSGAVWNNASYNRASLSVAPGMIAAVFGTNLTDGSTCVPPCYPALVDGKLGTTMAGAQVTINGVPIPLFYATSIQLGIQIPTELTGTSATIQVTVGGQTSVSVTIPVEPFSPGIFTVNQQGTGAGAIHHLDAAGTRVSSQAPARPGEEVDIYCTGLGLVSPPIATGAIPSGNVTVTRPTVTVDGVPATVGFSGLSGCCAGIYQVRIRIPSAARSGNDIPVVLSIGGKQANPVTMAVSP